MSTIKTSFFWKIDPASSYRGTTTVIRPKNGLDAHGTFLDLPRLPEESGDSYYKRLQSVLPLRAGSHYEGLIHGITRELGLSEKIGIKISPVYAGDRWKAPAPFVDITSTHLILYSQYNDDEDNDVIDKSISIAEKGGDGYLLTDLVSQIQSSEYFVAELGPQADGTEKSDGLFISSSHKLIQKENTPSNTFFKLKNSDVIPGTLVFSDKIIFSTEVSPAVSASSSGGIDLSWAVSTPIAAKGEYSVDYINGSVNVYTAPQIGSTCRYIYRDFPFQVRWSPIVIRSLRNTEYRTALFEDETMPTNQVEDGLVTAEGREVYQQIFIKSPSLWGE